ncbi:hypothetical protein WKV44_03580 [Spirochaetia bacterium 38H-sp]|uniref:Glycosyl hydrolase-like 10 domain-containing protein n=1 Tax=Rarispira pelagica TaxID=3141764 RepID=A0ABU9UAD7_9SPIR
MTDNTLPSSCVQLVCFPDVDFSLIEKKLGLAFENGIDTLIAWLPYDFFVYGERLRNICNKLGMMLYWWFPVLSDNPVHDTSSGIVPAHVSFYESRGDFYSNEEFVFICPNDSKNMAALFSYYERVLESGFFDGVFLDRIRFPSPANGFDMLFSCFCSYCMRKYPFLENYKELEHPVISFLSSGNRDYYDFLLVNGYGDWLKYRFSSIYDVVSTLSLKAKERNLTVALDLFSPSLSLFVGQDYRKLSFCADWIKPMVYISTRGPATLPYELEFLMCSSSAAGCDNSFVLSDLQRLCGILAVYSGCKISVPFSVFTSELVMASALSSCPVYAGVELVRVDNPNFSVDRNLVGVYADALLSMDMPFVASWDLLSIPDEYFFLMSREKNKGLQL